MLKRFYIYFVLALLFAMAQTGIVTHEISHLKELTQQSQPDKKQGSEPCTLCISLAHAAGALPLTAAWLLPPLAVQHATSAVYFIARSHHVAVYAARAPPSIISA